MNTASVVIALLLFLGVSSAFRTALNWHQVDVKGVRPTPRDNGAVFSIDQNRFAVFGGFYEQLALNRGDNIFYNGLYVFDASSRTWTLLSGDDSPNQSGPSVRAFSCGVYHHPSRNIVIFGGVNYTNDLNPETSTYYNDLWVFNLNTNTWTQRTQTGAIPAPRASGGCDILGDHMFYFSGNGPNFSTDNEMWRYDIVANSWTKVLANNPNPAQAPKARTQVVFERIPGQSKFLLYGGDTFIILNEPPFLDAVTVDDIWVYDASTNSWSQKDNRNTPSVIRTQQAFAFSSSRFLLVQNGDAQGNRTTDDTCPPPNFCILPATPTDDTFVYDTFRERWISLELDYTVPPTRRSMMRKAAGSLWMFGGYDWDGPAGRADIHNPYMWELDLSQGFGWLIGGIGNPFD